MNEEGSSPHESKPATSDREQASMDVLKSIAVGAAPIPATVAAAEAMVEATLQVQPGITTVPMLSTKAFALGGEPPPGVSPIPIHRLSAIEIQNYRAYRGTFRLELPRGANLLVYGENGGGKSSLFHTLRVFLEAPSWLMVDPTTKKSRASRLAVWVSAPVSAGPH